MLNLADGGLGPTGIEWTAEMREAARIRSTGRKIPARFGQMNPFYQRQHSAEQRAKWSIARKGINVGADNPNYGKFGPAHPSFGRVMSEEARQKLADIDTELAAWGARPGAPCCAADSARLRACSPTASAGPAGASRARLA